MLAELYFFSFMRSFLFSLAVILIFLSLRKKKDLRVGERHIHAGDVSRWGGVAVILAFWFSIFSDPNLVFSLALGGMLLGSVAILIFGVWDDLWEISWKKQLFFQIGLATVGYFWGIKADFITNPLGGIISLENLGVGIIFVIGWLVLSINSMNWLDGTDGLSGGVALLGAVTIFLLVLRPEVNQPPVAIITASLAGAILAFLIFNFHPSRIMAGSSGSMFFGFILGALAIFAGTKLATALLVMALPIADFIWVIGERLKVGVSIFAPDQRHLHHQLLRLGWSQTKIALFFYSFTACLSVLALNTALLGKLSAILLGLILIVGFRIFVARQLKLKAC
jgi:UDP-GlcNAc:undecaprenyl-phosphate GlcNAc-1-phosphate transferase